MYIVHGWRDGQTDYNTSLPLAGEVITYERAEEEAYALPKRKVFMVGFGRMWDL